MIPISTQELFNKNQKPITHSRIQNIQPPMFVDLSESEDSFYYGAPEPLDRSDGEIGGDIYMKNLIDRRPEPGLAKIAGAPKQRNN